MQQRAKKGLFRHPFILLTVAFSLFALSTYIGLRPNHSSALQIDKKHVYHASAAQGLTSIKPHKSTHGEIWVYAAYDPVIAASFIAREREFSFAKETSDETGVFYIVERHERAFKAYEGIPGSIYKLSSSTFAENQTDWNGELVSYEAIPVLEETKIDDTFAFLKDMERKGKLKLYYYPDRPDSIPADDSDLIEKAANRIKQGIPGTKKKFLELHPHLEKQLSLHLDKPRPKGRGNS